MTNTLAWDALSSPIGELQFAVSEAGVAAIRFKTAGERDLAATDIPDTDRLIRDAVATRALRDELTSYLAGELRAFTVPADLRGTPFQVAVWRRLLEIPFGETTTYGALARALGQPGASRAVGLANNRNRIGILVPCHRVVGADGALVGYGGGLERKRFLLRLEAPFQKELFP